MIYLLDTNVLSQEMVDTPHLVASQFLDNLREEQAGLSVVCLMEVRAGIERLKPDSKKRERLERWLSLSIPEKYGERILPITIEIADVAGRMLAAEKKAARTPHIPDLQIAATAKVHGFTVATLNHQHFETLGVGILNLNK